MEPIFKALLLSCALLLKANQLLKTYQNSLQPSLNIVMFMVCTMVSPLTPLILYPKAHIHVLETQHRHRAHTPKITKFVLPTIHFGPRPFLLQKLQNQPNDHWSTALDHLPTISISLLKSLKQQILYLSSNKSSYTSLFSFHLSFRKSRNKWTKNKL